MRIKTFALAFPLFFTSLCAVGQEVTDVKTQINQIKKNTSDYIYAEITATTEPDAKMLAEDLLYEEINKWAATQQNLQASQDKLHYNALDNARQHVSLLYVHSQERYTKC